MPNSIPLVKVKTNFSNCFKFMVISKFTLFQQKIRSFILIIHVIKEVVIGCGNKASVAAFVVCYTVAFNVIS